MHTEATRAVDALPHRAHALELAAARVVLRARRPAGVRALCVVAFDGADAAVRVVCGDGPLALSVGRHDAADVALARADGSLRHLLVVADDRGVHVVDLASSFGTAGAGSAAHGVPVRVVAGPATVVAVVVDADEDIPDLGASVSPNVALRVFREADVARAVSAVVVPAVVAAVVDVAAGTLPLVGLSRPVLLGRDARNDVQIACDEVSRVHAVLLPVWTGGVARALLVDVGSTNGTRVLGVRRGRLFDHNLGPALRACCVEPGDLVWLAHHELRVVGPTRRDAAAA